VIVLDTDVLSFLLRSATSTKRADAVRALQELDARGERFATTRLNIAELYVGIFLAPDPDVQELRLAMLLSGLSVLELDFQSARRFGKIESQLRGQGVVIGEFDTLVACIALSHDAAIFTGNRKHFSRVAGLQVLTF
jgi:tRNA(fMet)-specific endonuclease VapC